MSVEPIDSSWKLINESAFSSLFLESFRKNLTSVLCATTTMITTKKVYFSFHCQSNRTSFSLSPRKKKISGIFHFLAHHPNKRTVDFLKINIPPAHTKKIDLLLLLFLYTAIRLEKVNLLDRWCEIIQSFLSPTAMISSILSSGNRLLFFSNEIQLFDQ